MDAIERGDRRRLVRLAREIQEFLRLDNSLEYKYAMEKEPDGRTLAAVAVIRRLLDGVEEVRMSFYPEFFVVEFREQIRILLHEHVHILLNPAADLIIEALRAGKNVNKKWMGRREKVIEKATNQVTDAVFEVLMERIVKGSTRPERAGEASRTPK